MSYGGTPKPLGPEFDELRRDKERERDAERESVVLEAEAAGRKDGAGSLLARLGRMLRLGRDRTAD